MCIRDRYMGKAVLIVMNDVEDYERGYGTTEGQRLQINEGRETGPLADKYYGKFLVLATNERGEAVYLLGPHWPFFLFMFLFLGMAGLVIGIQTYSYIPFYQVAGTILLTMLNLYCYASAAFSDPGIPRRVESDETSQSHKRYCKICKIVRANGTYHCQVCDVCVEGYDHHCPWTSKCIGRGNIRGFYCFIAMTTITLIVSILSLTSILTSVSYTHLTLPTIYSV
eukprot:TRINITY_DN10468_c0_g1_i6.p1 TRINITY_DN10468_c0_g1~~TRINITY_DN10468_c0_g1_i6.p1  ORF type:complete len:241 (-),score=10.35 TRINITY_DN10468_c0_g1_i6:42-716(-)